MVLLGFFREASSLLEEIRQRHSEESLKDLLVVDFNPEAHHRMKEMGIQCKYGDIGHTDALRHLGIEHAELLVCTIPDHLLKGTSNLKLLRSLKSIAPEANIIVTARLRIRAQNVQEEERETTCTCPASWSVQQENRLRPEQVRTPQADASWDATACVFASLCRFAHEACTQQPALRPVPGQPHRTAACHVADEWRSSIKERKDVHA